MYKILIILLAPIVLFAKLNIAVTYPYIGAITKTIGGESVDTTVLSKGNWDPHFIVPRPSLISKIRNSDGIIINGAQLEIGWLPQLVRRSGNSKVNISSKSFLNLSTYIDLVTIVKFTDRSAGDVHPNGNPHFHLDPENILIIANVIKGYLSVLDSSNKALYEKNYKEFQRAWKEKMTIWSKKMADKRGLKVIQFHNNMAYFNKRYGIKTIGTIEPLPGIPASSKHTMELIELVKEKKPKYIFQDVYHQTKSAKYISAKTGIEVITMPHDIGSLDEIEDLTSLFDYLVHAIK